MGRWEAESLRCWDKTKGMSNWKFCNRDPDPRPFSSFTPGPLPRAEGTGDQGGRTGESRFGEGSEIKRAAPGGDLCVIEGPRNSARLPGLPKEKWE